MLYSESNNGVSGFRHVIIGQISLESMLTMFRLKRLIILLNCVSGEYF